MTPDQDHALRTAAVWEQRRWEAVCAALAGWGESHHGIAINLRLPNESQASVMGRVAVLIAESAIAAARPPQEQP